MTFRRFLLTLSLGAVLMSGCASAPRMAFTEAEEMAAQPTGTPGIRYWADAPVGAFQGARHVVAEPGRPFVYLALSGGGGGGAYGAGLLNGWTQSGTRPQFTMVSGVSTGALIAPFAFLGPDYDATLKQMYTSGDAARLIGHPNIFGPIFGPALFGRAKLINLVDRYLSADLLAAIAREDHKGRRLEVVTTNLDAQRAVIWDMGAIADIGGPKALKLFREVLAASASVPVIFAPQLIEVEANGRTFQELHADGTVSAPIYTLPDAILFGGKTIVAGAPPPDANAPVLFVIVNGRLDPGFKVLPNKAVAIAAQSFVTMNRVGAKAVLAQTYDAAKREGFAFHLSYVGPDLAERGGSGFETDAMRELYGYGYDKARSGSFWVTRLAEVQTLKEAIAPSATQTAPISPKEEPAGPPK